MTTLPEFIELGRRQGRANLHLKVPGFKVFYARYGRRWLNGKVYSNVLDFATIEVHENLRRTGVCTNLIKQIQTDYPDVSIFVENCSSELKPLMHKLGFSKYELAPDCFYQLGPQCSVSTSTTGTTLVVGPLSGSGSGTLSAGTGTTTTSKETKSESSEPADSPASSSTTDRSITSYKRRSPTWQPKDSKSPRKD